MADNKCAGDLNKIIVLDSDEEDKERQGTEQIPTTHLKRRRRRKSALIVRDNPEVQFESISLNRSNNAETSHKLIRNRSAQSSAVTSTAVQARTSASKHAELVKAVRTPSAEIVEQINRKLLDKPEINELIRRIAEERIRINTYLNVLKVPELDFTLYAGHDQLKTEIEIRLKMLAKPKVTEAVSAALPSIP